MSEMSSSGLNKLLSPATLNGLLLIKAATFESIPDNNTNQKCIDFHGIFAADGVGMISCSIRMEVCRFDQIDLQFQSELAIKTRFCFTKKMTGFYLPQVLR